MDYRGLLNRLSAWAYKAIIVGAIVAGACVVLDGNAIGAPYLDAKFRSVPPAVKDIAVFDSAKYSDRLFGAIKIIGVSPPVNHMGDVMGYLSGAKNGFPAAMSSGLFKPEIGGSHANQMVHIPPEAPSRTLAGVLPNYVNDYPARLAIPSLHVVQLDVGSDLRPPETAGLKESVAHIGNTNGSYNDSRESCPKHSFCPESHGLLGVQVSYIFILLPIVLWLVGRGFQIMERGFNAIEGRCYVHGNAMVVVGCALSCGSALLLPWGGYWLAFEGGLVRALG
jgi:hypothetical protein